MNVVQHQIRIFFIIAVIVLLASAVSLAVWGERPIDWSEIRVASTSLIVISFTIGSAAVICALLLAYKYDWWGNAQGAVVYIAMGAFFSFIGSVFELFALLGPMF